MTTVDKTLTSTTLPGQDSSGQPASKPESAENSAPQATQEPAHAGAQAPLTATTNNAGASAHPAQAPTPAVKPSAIVPPVGIGAGKPASASSSASIPPASSLAKKVNAAVPVKLPAGLRGFNTSQLSTPWFHGMIYGETSARKTSTAAKFSPKEATLLVLSRQEEQLIPLRQSGLNVLHVTDAEALTFAAMYPEKAAEAYFGKEWAKQWENHPERTLIVDDLTESVELLKDENMINPSTGEEYKDMRKVYGGAGKDLRELFNSARRKPQHIILVALAKVKEYGVANEESIMPDMPPSMTGMVTTDLEYVFFIQKRNWKFVTEKAFLNYVDTDDKGKEHTYRREIFAKNKIDLTLVGKRVIDVEEDMDLRAIWERIKSGTTKK